MTDITLNVLVKVNFASYWWHNIYIYTLFILWSGPSVLISYNARHKSILYIPGCPQPGTAIRRFQGRPNFNVWGRQRNVCVKPCGAQRTAASCRFLRQKYAKRSVGHSQNFQVFSFESDLPFVIHFQSSGNPPLQDVQSWLLLDSSWRNFTFPTIRRSFYQNSHWIPWVNYNVVPSKGRSQALCGRWILGFCQMAVWREVVWGLVIW